MLSQCYLISEEIQTIRAIGGHCWLLFSQFCQISVVSYKQVFSLASLNRASKKCFLVPLVRESTKGHFFSAFNQMCTNKSSPIFLIFGDAQVVNETNLIYLWSENQTLSFRSTMTKLQSPHCQLRCYMQRLFSQKINKLIMAKKISVLMIPSVISKTKNLQSGYHYFHQHILLSTRLS